MRFAKLLIALVVILLLSTNVYALDYEDKPDITAYIAGSNHFERGDEKTVMLVVYNPAEKKKVDYSDLSESMFFSNNENMFFTAYNVELELEGNDYIEIKTPPQKIPALSPFQPVNLQFQIKVSDDVKAGEYDLKLKVKFDRIGDLLSLDKFSSPTWVYYQKTVQGANETTTYQYKTFTQYYKIRYDTVEKTITIPIYIEKEAVKLEILKVKAENMQAKGKGKITVEVKNVGEKTGKNAYLVLVTPSEFEAKNTLQSLTTEQLKSLFGLLQMQLMQGKTQALTQSVPMLSLSTGTVFVGDLKLSQTVSATFTLKINTKEEGNYPFQIKAVYLDEYGNIVESDPVSFGVYIEPAPKFEILSVDSNVLVNVKGDVKLSIRCDRDVEGVSVALKTTPPLSALSSEYYLGDLKADEEKTAVFKVKASSEAKAVVYPAEIVFKYKVADEWVESDAIKIGIKVNPKIKFEIIGIPEIAAGGERIVSVTIKNTGKIAIREATARITIVDPFSSTDDTAYIGTLNPNESKEVSFKIKASKDATPKLYGLNLEVKYKDLEGEWAISEPVKMEIKVTPAKPPTTMFIVLAVLVMIAVGYAIKRRRR
ncbi:S-layer protein [Archaeoglobales archaeon]|nr:MAG: S-layer protein [Archaeoglobales archaeon]